MKLPLPRCLYLLLLLTIIIPRPAKAYSVLTHEALIDASWKGHILPLLKIKYPDATGAELSQAHAYAYGGCLIADMGYFPFGSAYFTNLAHYVRSGDFVEALLAEADNLNEYAFAIGALCHYMGDKYGHAIATNHVVPLTFHKLKDKYGNVVTYEENPSAHRRVEISFDVLQTARGNYAAQAYHDFIGFEVAKPVLERAFIKTYGQDINDVFSDLDLAIGTFRWSVKSLLPDLTRSAWVLKKADIKKVDPSANSRSFHYKMERKDYNKEFGAERQKPGLNAQIIAFIIRILPKIGPLKLLKFKDVGTQGESLFIKSFDTVLVNYNYALEKLKTGRLALQDVDYDTGLATAPGEYGLADETYDDLLINLDKNKYKGLTSPLKQNILNFYSKADTLLLAKTYPKDWKKAGEALQILHSAKTVMPDSLKNTKGIYYKYNGALSKPFKVSLYNKVATK